MINPRATHLLIRHQEIALKGKNRPEFERLLRNNLAKCVGSQGNVSSVSGRFVVELANREGIPQLVDRLATIAGVAAVTPCLVTKPELDLITSETLDWAKHDLDARPEAATFAIRARRIDKKFQLTSNQLDLEVGSRVRKLRDGMTVNLKKPDLKIAIEVRHHHALIYSWEKAGVRGLPMNATQRIVCLLSGGIDSPVAAYELMRRGCTPIFVHFHSKPFTSEASVAKVKRLAGVLRKLSPHPLEMWLVPLLEIQKAVRDSCNERYRTIHYRRFMMMIAEEIANRRGAKALVTGDALGQVASQTLTNMQAIEDVVRLPVLRPLVAHDKQDIVAKARILGTFEISIEPHDDTCVLFAPDHPSTQAKLSILREESEALPVYDLVFAACDAAEKVLL
ncbi:MAG: tRNA 4-thiouridine(8) synthase ThiI [Deltaproteobacteria bacterium]|nr:tRNA 4-thiouridine(8) synthase ThiI [Deltaproteobacteria bacterium]